MAGHRVTMTWMGSAVETLADLVPPEPRAMVVGINPAPPSVAAGHYYQGRQGQRFFTRLRQSGLLPSESLGFEDDDAVAIGIGFTDIVKRPTATADEVTRAELRHGAGLLADKLSAASIPVLIFPFKAAAVALIGRFDGNGWLDQQLAHSRLFVMPGPYESTTTAEPTIASLLPRLS